MAESDLEGQKPVPRLKERGDVDALLALLHDSDYYIVVAAAKALAELDEQRAVDPLLRLVRGLDPRSMAVEWELLTQPLARLATPGSASADYLLTIVEAEEFWVDASDGYRPIALRAAWRLVEMGDRRVIDVLLRRIQMTAPDAATDDTFWEWAEIAEILAALDAVEAVEPLAAALPLAPVHQQMALVQALRELGDARAVPGLIAALEAHHGSNSLASNDLLVTLEEFGTPEALQAVKEWDSNPQAPWPRPKIVMHRQGSPRKRFAALVRRVLHTLRWSR